MANQEIAGKWRGHYQVPNFPQHDSTFTAFISENGGHIEGAIEDDCQLGEATLTGTFSFPSVQFTKVYLKQGRIDEVIKKGDKTVIVSAVYGPPIEYQGTMSNDGKEISGKWTISSENARAHGTWTAYRLDEKEKEKEKSTQTDKPSAVKESEEQLVEVS
jgi:hypothetical protein